MIDKQARRIAFWLTILLFSLGTLLWSTMAYGQGWGPTPTPIRTRPPTPRPTMTPTPRPAYTPTQTPVVTPTPTPVTPTATPTPIRTGTPTPTPTPTPTGSTSKTNILFSSFEVSGWLTITNAPVGTIVTVKTTSPDGVLRNTSTVTVGAYPTWKTGIHFSQFPPRSVVVITIGSGPSYTMTLPD